jgi:hypothetical protein
MQSRVPHQGTPSQLYETLKQFNSQVGAGLVLFALYRLCLALSMNHALRRWRTGIRSHEE